MASKWGTKKSHTLTHSTYLLHATLEKIGNRKGRVQQINFWNCAIQMNSAHMSQALVR